MDSDVQNSGPASGARKRATSHPPAFDTIQAVQHLKDVGFVEKQAMTIAETLRDAQSELATKSDLERTEVAIRADMEKMGFDLRAETMALRNEMNSQFATLYWRLLLGASVMTGILGTLITLTGAKQL